MHLRVHRGDVHSGPDADAASGPVHGGGGGGAPCTVDRSSAVREDATSPSVRSRTGLEGRHPGLSPTAEFPLLHKGVAASGCVTWQGLLHDRPVTLRMRPPGIADGERNRRAMAMQTRCAGTARAPGRALPPSVCSGLPALGLRRAEPGARSGPGRRARGLVGRERGCPPVPAPVVGRCVPIPPLVPPSRRLCSLVL